jgi:hypothetical protein
MNRYHEMKPFLRKVIKCTIVSSDTYSIKAVFNNGDTQITVRCSTSRTPVKLYQYIKKDAIISIYMAKIDIEHIEGNLYSKQIPEQLLKKIIKS